MKQKACELKDRKVAPPTDSELLRRIIELQKLREQVRLAEVAIKPNQMRLSLNIMRSHQHRLLTVLGAYSRIDTGSAGSSNRLLREVVMK